MAIKSISGDKDIYIVDTKWVINYKETTFEREKKAE